MVRGGVARARAALCPPKVDARRSNQPALVTSHARTRTHTHTPPPRAGIDHFVARVAPARRYDHLDADFNRGVMAVGLAAMGAATYALGLLATRKERAQQWR